MLSATDNYNLFDTVILALLLEPSRERLWPLDIKGSYDQNCTFWMGFYQPSLRNGGNLCFLRSGVPNSNSRQDGNGTLVWSLSSIEGMCKLHAQMAQTPVSSSAVVRMPVWRFTLWPHGVEDHSGKGWKSPNLVFLGSGSECSYKTNKNDCCITALLQGGIKSSGEWKCSHRCIRWRTCSSTLCGKNSGLKWEYTWIYGHW